MYPNVSRRSVLVAALLLIVATWTACSKTSASGNTAPSSDAGKVAITTKSNDARAEFLQGRDLSEKLLAQDSLQHFEKAIALDPDFATAELARANNSPTAKEFFEHLNKAVSLADKTSDGEKLLILANEAAANGNVPKQKDTLDKLVAEYPTTNGHASTWATTISASRISTWRLSNTRKPRSWPLTIRPPTTFSGMLTGSKVIT